ILFLGIGLFAKGKRAGVFIFVTDVILSFILYANVVYYRFNNDFITLPTLTQTSNIGSLGGSILDLVAWHDDLYKFDFMLLFTLCMTTMTNLSARLLLLLKLMIILTAGVVALTINLGLAEIDRPQLLKRTFDRTYIVKYLGTYNFMIYDMVLSLKSSTQRVMANSNDITNVENYTKDKYAKPNEA